MTAERMRIWLAGALTPPVLFLGFLGATALYWPDIEGLMTLARITDSLAPHLLVLALLGGLVLAALRAWVAAGLGIALAVVGLGTITLRHMEQSVPPATGAQTDLTILWFNVLGTNGTSPDALAAALADSPADVVILGEAFPLRQQREALTDHFPHQTGCARKYFCEVMVLARGPVTELSVSAYGRTQEERMGRIVLDLPGRAPVTVLAVHMAKPWFFGFAERDILDIMAVLEETGGPMVVTGDFNAAPWSRRLQELSDTCDLVFPRMPVPTWPVAAGALGVPIDQMLVRDGAQLVSLEPWGEGLGSNHRGLLARIALPDTAPDAPPRPDCVP